MRRDGKKGVAGKQERCLNYTVTEETRSWVKVCVCGGGVVGREMKK